MSMTPTPKDLEKLAAPGPTTVLTGQSDPLASDDLTATLLAAADRY